MSASLRRAILFGIAAMTAAFAAVAATISSPYRPTASSAAAGRLNAPGQEALDFERAVLLALRIAGADSVRIEGFPLAPGVTGTLLLRRFEVTTPDARVTVSSADGEQSFPFPSTAHFSGTIEGDPDSAVYLGAQEDRVVTYLRSSAGFTYVGPDESGADFVVRAAESPLNDAVRELPFACPTEDLPAALTATAEPSFAPPMLPLAGLKQAAVRVETDFELYNKFGNPTGLANYVAALYGAINVVYESNLSLHLAVAEVHMWTTGAGSDPYVSTDTRTQLAEVGDWWHANRPMASYPRAMVHFLSGKAVSGGIAWLSVLCSGDFSDGQGHWGGAYGVTQVYGSYPTLQLWDQFATAHEMGHNAGSHHTHCYSPPIDHCYNGEPGCYSGPVENPGVGNGTIMSYCHLLGWQYVSMQFHARCINEQMMPEINGASCLTQASTFIDVPPSHPFFQYVETLAANGVTRGCGGAYFCPDASVTRAQMAVFLLKSKFGASHVPPAATGAVFADVPANAFAAAWIEELANMGVTTGCGGGNYCPGAAVSRRQMAAFLLKTKNGSGYTPPNPVGVFADVPVSDGSASWIEELYAETITGGCLTNPLRYCPDNPNTRGQMAVFLVKTFNLQ